MTTKLDMVYDIVKATDEKVDKLLVEGCPTSQKANKKASKALKISIIAATAAALALVACDAQAGFKIVKLLLTLI